MAISARIAFTLSLILFLTGNAFAERRVALVIGNSGYENASALPNPARDARAVAAALRGAGFAEVIEGYDLSKSEFDAALKRFGDAAQGADWALIYFAGHGIAVGGETYLLPTDVTLNRVEHVDDEAVPLARLRAKASGAKALRMVILDSCRNNPFAPRMKDDRTAKRAVNPRGLARPSEPDGGELIAYATRENDVADDGNGMNSPFTAAFLAEIEKPGVEVNLLFRRVRSAVLRATNKAQEPAIYQSLPEDSFYFRPPSGVDANLKEKQAASGNGAANASASGHGSKVAARPVEEETGTVPQFSPPSSRSRPFEPVTPPPAYEEKYYFVWDTRPPDDWLDLWTLPGGRGTLIRHMPNGTALELLGKGPGKWYNFRVVETGEIGWAAWGDASGRRIWVYCCRTLEAFPANPQPYRG